MRYQTWTALLFTIGSSTLAIAAVGSVDQGIPSVSRDSVRISKVRRGDLVHRVEACGFTRQSDDAGVEVVLRLEADKTRDVMIGQPALVGLGRGLHRGRVTRLGGLAPDQFEVSIALDQSPGIVLSGQPAVASILTGQTRGRLIVDKVPGLTPGTTVSWFKIDSRQPGFATRVAVQIGITTANRAEVSGDTLAHGDAIVTLGLELLPPEVDRVRLR